MKQYPFLKTRWWSAAFGVFLFAMLLLSRDTLITSLRLGFYRSQFLMLAAMGLLGLAFLVENRRNLREILTDRRMLLMIALSVLCLLLMVLKQDWQMMYFSILLCPVFAVFLTYFMDSRQVSRYYLVLLAALAVYSVFATYLMRRLVWDGLISAPVRMNDAEMEFYDFFLCFAGTKRFWHRNFGIFREPGVYQFFLILGLYLNNYTAGWEKPWKLWTLNVLLAITMVTTFSIGGIAEMVVFAVFVYFDKGYYRTRSGKWAGIGVCFALAVAVAGFFIRMQMDYFAHSILYEFYDMFVRLTTDSDSLMDRLSAIFTDAAFFLDHPLLGADIAPVLHGTNHNTSSTLILYAILGFFGGTLHVAAWIALLWKKERNVLGNLILLGVLFLSFNTQNLVADLFFWLFPCMAVVERGLPLCKRHKKEEG